MNNVKKQERKMSKCNRCDKEMKIQGRSTVCPQCGARLVLFDEETLRFNSALQEEKRSEERRRYNNEAKLVVEEEDQNQFVEGTAPDFMLQVGYCEKCQEEFSIHCHNIISVCPCPHCDEPMAVDIVEDCPVVLEIVENEI